jgi:hypothetical protein
MGEVGTDGGVPGLAIGSKYVEAIVKVGVLGRGGVGVETVSVEGVNPGVDCDRQPVNQPISVKNKIQI